MSFLEYVANREADHFARYIEFKAHQDGVSLEEAAARSMGRLFGQLQSGQNTIVIITAFRSENSLNNNRQLNLQLCNDIRGLGWGYTPVLGGFVEEIVDDSGKPAKKRVHEESFFVNTGRELKQVVANVTELLTKYHQDAALIKPANSEQAFFLLPNGNMDQAGIWKNDPKQMAVYYTRMRKGVPGRQFTFDAARDDTISTRQAVDSYFKKT